MTNHTALLRLSSLLLAGSIVVPAATEAGPGSQPAWHEPRITYVDQPTPKAREIVAWAVDQYREAGLQLSDLTISFPALCDGKGALYHVGKRAIDFCRINKRRALHEFAHAWDDTSGAVDRAAFLEAVTGYPQSRARAEAIVEERLPGHAMDPKHAR